MVRWSRLFRALIDFTVTLIDSMPVTLGEPQTGEHREQAHRPPHAPSGQDTVQAGGRTATHDMGDSERDTGGGEHKEVPSLQRATRATEGAQKKSMRLQLPKKREDAEKLEEKRSNCPICDMMSPLCDSFEDRAKRRRCWELVYKVSAGLITPEEFADRLYALDPERVRKWLESRRRK